jgi:hypothetical protein
MLPTVSETVEAIQFTFHKSAQTQRTRRKAGRGNRVTNCMMNIFFGEPSFQSSLRPQPLRGELSPPLFTPESSATIHERVAL